MSGRAAIERRTRSRVGGRGGPDALPALRSDGGGVQALAARGPTATGAVPPGLAVVVVEAGLGGCRLIRHRQGDDGTPRAGPPETSSGIWPSRYASRNRSFWVGGHHGGETLVSIVRGSTGPRVFEAS